LGCASEGKGETAQCRRQGKNAPHPFVSQARNHETHLLYTLSITKRFFSFQYLFFGSAVKGIKIEEKSKTLQS